MSKLFTCEEVAERYGVQIITVWDWIRKKKLPAIKIGKSYRIREDDLLKYEEASRTVKTEQDKKQRKYTYIGVINPMKWQVKSFINGKPIEEYSEKEVDDFFKKAWDKAFRAIGYEPFIDKQELEKCSKITCQV